MDNNIQHPENDSRFRSLNVNQGPEKQPPVVNPYMTRVRRKPLPAPDELVEGIL